MTVPEGQNAESLLALAGIRVLELGHTVMGPSCSMVLADLGADVIKVEPPEGDRTRANVGFGSALFPVFNRNKRSLCIDLKSEAGKTVFRKVAVTADALIENFAPGTMDRLAIGYEALSALNPKLVFCSLKGFLSGPYENRPALAEIVQYMGQQALTGVAPPPMPEKASSWAVYDTFQTADDKTVFVGITSDNHWRSFCKGFGVEELLDDPTLKTNPQRAQARARIMPVVRTAFSAETFETLCAKLERMNIPFGPLAQPGDLFDDPHLNHAGRMLDILLPTGKHAKIPGLPLDMDGRATRVRRQPPRMGEHSREVLRESGYTAEQADRFLSDGIVIET